jgi:hypothetical protein
LECEEEDLEEMNPEMEFRRGNDSVAAVAVAVEFVGNRIVVVEAITVNNVSLISEREFVIRF